MKATKRFKAAAGSYSSFLRRHPRLSVLLKFLPIFLVFLLFSDKTLDPDFGWHLQAGNYIRLHWIPPHDIFTYTARNFAWIDHEWGNDVLTSFIYQHFGYIGLSVVFSLAWTGALFIVGKRVSIAVLSAASLAMLPYAGIRPIAWTVLGLAVVMGLAARRSRFTAIAVPLVFVVWANLHGGFVIGLAYLAYLAIARRSRFWALMLAASTAATFLNPYGPRLYVEVARTLTDNSLHSQILEWHTAYFPVATLPYICLWGAGFWVIAKRRLKNWLSFEMIMLIGSVSASKNVPLFALSSLNSTDQYLKTYLRKLPKGLNFPRRAVLAIIAAAFVIGYGYGLKTQLLPLGPRDSVYPVQAVNYLKLNGCPGQLFNGYNYGGYLIWKLPKIPVYIDGRMSAWRNPQGERYLTLYLKELNDKQLLEAQFHKYDIRCALVGESGLDSQVAQWLSKQGWNEKIRANGSILLVANNK